MKAYHSDWQRSTHKCHQSGGTGTYDEAHQESFDGLIQVDFATCDARILLVLCPTAEETREAASRSNEDGDV